MSKKLIKKVAEKYKKLNSLYQIMLCIIVGIMTGLFVSNCLLTRAEVIGSSMEPTYYSGDSVFVCRVSKPSRGDEVVVVGEDGKNLIKRVIGMPGDTIQITDSKVFVNGMLYEEEYLLPDIMYDGGIAESPIVLKGDEYFVLGDNRPVSKDSRVIGPISKENMVGVVIG